MEKFNKNVEYFLQTNKNEYSKNLEKSNYRFNQLLKELHIFINKLLENNNEKFTLEDEIFDNFYELIQIESIYMYKKGFKDCYKIIKLLEKN